MKYFKKFSNVTDANTSGSNGLNSPHVDLCLDTVNMIQTSTDTFKAIFDNDGKMSLLCTVTLTAGTGGTVSGAGTYASGTTITITATPNLGWEFSYWSDGSIDASRTITVNSDITLSCTFTKGVVDLSMVDVNGTALSARETANCYVIKVTGDYKLPLVYGNAIMNGATNSASYTQVSGDYTQPFYNYLNNQIVSPYIETDTGVTAASGDILLSDSSSFTISDIQVIDGSPCRYLKFTVTSVPALGGNITLGIKNSSGVVMWSWHLWAYSDTLTTCAHTNDTGYTYNMLNVNLGWVKDSAGSKYGTSPYYQWGRKDPMLRPTNSTSNTNATVSAGSFSITTVASSVAATIQNPNVFNTYESTKSNWWQKNGAAVDFYNYWDASQTATGYADKTVVKTVYDPCPVGFAIPCGNAFTGFSAVGSFDRGYTWDGRYFSRSGSRNASTGNISGVTENGAGLYWTAAIVDQSTAYRLYFYKGSGGDTQGASGKATGASVCPVSLPELI